ncbi:hypothetical protein JOQ06_000611 [Pogonophryne albipinna]|uniref:HAT C-terminal dimerisation domain-containing protein n=1 Tax=Pogonophryne albipinna TaxID=1090488 RepID=A0AAD6F7I8_9TELE|nr:hypothetical protein JOQ06_000611 [Pogonophryne albipinna]
MPTDDTVEAQREEEETQPEEVAAGPSEATTGDASPTAYPSIWKEEQYEQFQQKNEWMYAHNGRLGCTPCHDVKDLGVMASRGVNIAIQWADGKIIPAGQSRDVQLSSLRKKIREHKNSAAHNEAVKILQTANKDILLNMNASSQESVFESTAKVFMTAYYVAKNNKPFTDFESLIDLQQANSADLGRVLHSKTVCVDIIEHVSSQMKKELLKKIIETKSKITVLADESTLIVFLKASVDGDMEPIAFPLDLSPKNMRQLSECAHNLDIALRRIGKVFSVRWVASSWRAVSAVWQSYPALAQHFREASEDDTRDSRERAKFKGLLSKLYSINFLKSLALMADVLTELKNLSEILQNRKTTLPKAHDIMTTYVKRIESFNRYPGQHAVDASQAEEVMEFKGEELRVGRSPIIDSAQFIRAVADNMKERLFTTTANRAQASVAANRKEAYNSLINQMAVLNPDNWDHDNPRFGDNEVRALCDVLHVNQQEAHLGFTEYKASGGRNIPNKMKKLLMAVDTLSPSNADCERGFSTMNNIITEYRSKLTTKNAANLLFISSVGPPCRQWDPLPYVKTWLGKGRRAAHSTSCMARRYTEEESYFSPLWKMLTC